MMQNAQLQIKHILVRKSVQKGGVHIWHILRSKPILSGFSGLGSYRMSRCVLSNLGGSPFFDSPIPLCHLEQGMSSTPHADVPTGEFCFRKYMSSMEFNITKKKKKNKKLSSVYGHNILDLLIQKKILSRNSSCF